MTGSTAQLVNGIALITSFGGSRLVWGIYQSFRMYQDIWLAFKTPGELPVPPWLAIAYVVSNTTLSVLNFYWFGKMIQALMKRFEKPGDNDSKKNTRKMDEALAISKLRRRYRDRPALLKELNLATALTERW